MGTVYHYARLQGPGWRKPRPKQRIMVYCPWIFMVPAPQAARGRRRRAQDGGLRWGGLALRPPREILGAACPPTGTQGGPQDAAPRASFTPRAREGQSAAMKWVRINEIWYEAAGRPSVYRVRSTESRRPAQTPTRDDRTLPRGQPPRERAPRLERFSVEVRPAPFRGLKLSVPRYTIRFKRLRNCSCSSGASGARICPLTSSIPSSRRSTIVRPSTDSFSTIRRRSFGSGVRSI